jgi:hypothetical protein
VRACKMQASSPVIYISCQFLAEELSRNPAPVPRPYQGRIGDCWLLAAMCGLHAFFPGLLLSMVVLGKKEAIIHFPRRAITVNYVLPFQAAPCSGLVGAFVHLGVQLCVPADLYWALLEKAMCVHLLLEGDPNLGARRQARRLRGNLGSGPHYSDIDGGTIYEALAALSPTFVKHPVRILGFNKEAFKKLRREGIFFVEVERGGSLHVLRVVGVAGTYYRARDTCGPDVILQLQDAAPIFVGLSLSPRGASCARGSLPAAPRWLEARLLHNLGGSAA